MNTESLLSFKTSIKRIKKEFPNIPKEEIDVLEKIYEQMCSFVYNATSVDYNNQKIILKEKLKEILNDNTENNLLKYMGYYLVNLRFMYPQIGKFRVKKFNDALFLTYETLLENKFIKPNEELGTYKNFVFYIASRKIKKYSWDLFTLAIKYGLNPDTQNEKGNTVLHEFLENIYDLDFDFLNGEKEAVYNALDINMKNLLNPLLKNNHNNTIWDIFLKLKNKTNDSNGIYKYFIKLIGENLENKVHLLSEINKIELENKNMRIFLLDTLKHTNEEKNYNSFTTLEEYKILIYELAKENDLLRARIKEIVEKIGFRYVISYNLTREIIDFITTGRLRKSAYLDFKESFEFGNILAPSLKEDIERRGEYGSTIYREMPMEEPKWFDFINVWKVDLNPKIIYDFTLRFWKYVYLSGNLDKKSYMPEHCAKARSLTKN